MVDYKAIKNIPQEELIRILRFISEQKSIDLCSYRQNFCFRHIRSRMQETGCLTASDYIRYIKENKEELDHFIDSLSINVTHFFRDKEVFEAFAKNALVELIQKKDSVADRGVIRVWSAACATGQEPYSLAILLTEALQKKPNFLIKILATDVDNDALEAAQKGFYEERDFREMDKKLLEKYFEPVYNGKYSVHPQIRNLVKFERHNLITDPPFKHMDIIFCRNVMIYFSRQQQDELIKKFYEGLNSGGFLVLAKVEMVWNKDLFKIYDLNNKIYQKINQ
ncbi:MAG: protein-glutamate O-methyltransferase CheR [Candidatus Omnitrophica bacterium]|nr:protein-glutamate O-methyltransferase CheR [Candidatus Omnitrophota bacterium]